MKKLACSFLAIVMMISLAACSGGTEEHEKAETKETTIDANEVKVDESYFLWFEDLIYGLSEAGQKQTNIVIPARCQGFDGSVFSGTNVERINFEAEHDIVLGGALIGADKLVSIQLPSDLTAIGNNAFLMCTSLKSISIPAAVSSLDFSAFSGCESLESVVFEGNLIEVIPDSCFKSCRALNHVVLPEGIKSIEQYAFNQCNSLSDVSLPESLRSIGKAAFGSTALETITFKPGTEFDSFDSAAFGTNAFSMTVHITAGSWCDMNREVWNYGFSEIIEE